MIRIVRKFAILFAVLTAQLYTAAAYYAWSLPDSYYTADSSTLELDTARPMLRVFRAAAL